MISKLTLRVKGLHLNTKIKEIKSFFAPLRVENVQFFKNGTCLVSFRHEEDFNKALVRQGQIRGRTLRIGVWCEKPLKAGKNETENQPKPSWPVKSVKELKSAIRESGRLFIRNLSFDCTEEDLEKLFSAFGALSDVHVSYDVVQQKSKGFAFVTFLFPGDAVAAFEKLDKTKFKDRLLHILPAQDPPEREPTRGDHSSAQSGKHLARSEYQETKHKDLKSSATVAHNWNALFVRPDAVATYLAAKFGLTKEQVLDPSGQGSVAVRLALAETQLVAEMREFLQRHHVNLDAFNTGSTEPDDTGRRDRLDVKASTTHRQVSGTAFLIKNLPVGTTEVEVRELLQQYTKQLQHDQSSSDPALKRFYPRRIIVPPLGITAIVEYATAQQARLLYRSLAYEPFQDNVLYVQWLPHGALDEVSSPLASVAETAAHEAVHDQEACASEFDIIVSPPDDDSRSQKDAFDNRSSKQGKKRTRMAAEEPVDPDQPIDSAVQPKTKQRKYKNKKERIRQQELQQMDEESPEVEDPNTSEQPAQPSPPQPPKVPQASKPVLLVRNVSFQATQKELTTLFQSIGGLVRVRLPQKAAGGHRGFAFLEFTTVDQAKLALETLGTDTHLLGRRLRIEFAQA